MGHVHVHAFVDRCINRHRYKIKRHIHKFKLHSVMQGIPHPEHVRDLETATQPCIPQNSVYFLKIPKCASTTSLHIFVAWVNVTDIETMRDTGGGDRECVCTIEIDVEEALTSLREYSNQIRGQTWPDLRPASMDWRSTHIAKDSVPRLSWVPRRPLQHGRVPHAVQQGGSRAGASGHGGAVDGNIQAAFLNP